MREHAAVVLRGERVRLVPYLKAHIQQYHAWMQDPELLRLTCSEALTLEEETANQCSWRDDAHKATFIVCALGADSAAINDSDMTAGMCGDVNAFLTPAEDDDSDCIDPMEVCYPANERCLSSGERGRAGDELHCWEQLLPAAPESGSKMIYI